jgi:hypothetical protein
LRADGLDVGQQCIVTDWPIGLALIDCSSLPMPANESVLHVECFAKYAAAFLNMSSSILVLASSAPDRGNSICSGITVLAPGFTNL